MKSKARRIHRIEIKEGAQFASAWIDDEMVDNFPTLAAAIAHFQQEVSECTGHETPFAVSLDWSDCFTVDATITIKFPVSVTLTDAVTFEPGV